MRKKGQGKKGKVGMRVGCGMILKDGVTIRMFVLVLVTLGDGLS